jgi:hypothetical protein
MKIQIVEICVMTQIYLLSVLYPEDRDTIFLRCTGNHVPDYTIKWPAQRNNMRKDNDQKYRTNCFSGKALDLYSRGSHFDLGRDIEVIHGLPQTSYAMKPQLCHESFHPNSL